MRTAGRVGPNRGRVLVRGITILPAWGLLALMRCGLGLLWPFAWTGALLLGRAPRWWGRRALAVVRRASRVRAYAWLLTDQPPRRSASLLVVQAPAAGPLPRRSILWRLVAAPWYALLRYLAGVFAVLFAAASWACLVLARRHPARLRAAQWGVQAYVVELDCWQQLLTPDRPRLPEPDPRLRIGGVPTPDHAPLPPFRRRTGWVAIAVDLMGGLLVSSMFYGFMGDSEGIIWLIFLADLAIQGLGPYLAIYFASQSGPLSVSLFGLHAIRPLRSLGWAVLLIGTYVAMLLSLVVFLAPFAADGGGIVPDGASTTWTIVFVAIGTVMAPMFEEFFYRGFLFQAMRERHGTWNAAAISSIAFAAAHFEFSPFALADRALIGVGLCWLFARTGRLLPGMFAHSINNAIVIPLVIGWDWQIAIVLPASLAVIALLATVASHRRGEWAPT